MITCVRCDASKKHIYFYLDHKSKNGRKSECMLCMNKDKKSRNRKRIRKNKESIRRKQSAKSINLVLYKRSAMTKDAQKVYNGHNGSLFMQHNHLIYKYVKETFELKFGEINVLLNVAPIEPFKRVDFLDCMRVIGFKSVGLFNRFVADDYIKIWRKETTGNRIPDLYRLSDKGRKLVNDIHLFALGKKNIPETSSKDFMSLLMKIHGKKS